MSDNTFHAEPGHLYGVGVGPGDPGLITRRVAGLIESADVVAYHQGSASRPSVARGIAEDLIPEGAIEEPLLYPVTTGATDHPDGYYGVMADFYEECAARLRAHLDAGRSVVVLAEGDPLFYGSFMYVHDLLQDEVPVHVVPGVTSPSAAAAALGTGLCRHEDTLTILPGTLPVAELARRLADTDAAIVMKLGRTFDNVREAVRQAGLLDRAILVERASSDRERVIPIAEVDAAEVPYMSLVVIPGTDLRADDAGRARAHEETPESSADPAAYGTVHVVGLGPGPDRWLTPEASSVLAQTDHVIGYTPYVARVPQREGLTRHSSGNTVEVDRGRLALDLALSGDDVCVVSGGDAGVFGMAAAVFEAAEADEADERYAAVPVHVVPGVTAAHAASALAGALLGADHALISLSDRLKPWEVLVDRLSAAARADLAIALYNPRSRTRPEQLGRAQAALLEVVPPERVVVVARHVGRAEESLRVTTLGELDPETVDMGCLVVIGASRTRVRPDGRVWTPRYVE
ncbi:MAG: precorrin-3B C(17)-methyltransferase [Micrococcales bacterium]|nr:precorrin-3B C(17)-methyltransferase [Micrococcales bacterium]